MLVRCPDVPLVFVALRIMMGKISGPRSHTPKYFTLILSSTVNLNSLGYLKMYRLCTPGEFGQSDCLQAAGDVLEIVSEGSSWVEAERSSIRILRMLGSSCKD